MGHTVAQLVKALHYKPGRSRVRFPMVSRIFHGNNPSGRTMFQGSTQPLTEMSTRNISWGVKAANAYSWQPYHLHVQTVMKSGILSLLEPSRPVQGLLYIFLPFTLFFNSLEEFSLYVYYFNYWTNMLVQSYQMYFNTKSLCLFCFQIYSYFRDKFLCHSFHSRIPSTSSETIQP